MDDTRKAPHATDERGVSGAVFRRSVLILGKVFDPYIGVCTCRWKLDDDAEEGILHEDCLPDFTPLLHLQGRGIQFDDGRVSVEAEGVGLSLQDTGERPGVGGVIVVHEEVGYEDHCLDGSHRWAAEVGEHPEGLV